MTDGVPGRAPAPSGPDSTLLIRIGEACMRSLPVSGAAISLMTPSGHRATAYASDAVAARVEDLHFELGEGPGVDAFRDRRPVLVGELGDAEEATSARWPAFTPAGRDAGVRAVFAFPLLLGAARLGVLVMYSDRASALDPSQHARALRLADAASFALLDVLGGSTTSPVDQVDGARPGGDPAVYRAEVYQASGMVMVQLASASRRRWCGCGRTHSPMTGRWSTWRVRSWRAGCASRPIMADGRADRDWGQVMSEPQKSRENRLAEAFVTLADTLVTGFDVADLFVDLAGACVELLEVTAAGLMLVDAGGRLRVMASSSERSRLLELMEIQDDEGPCLDCHREGTPVLVDDLAAQRDRWPSFADQAIRFGFGAVYALPLRLREEAIGALNLFHRDPYAISPADLRIGQALADVATIGVLQQRAVQRGAELSEQLQTALNSRLIIEQAKGVIAERDNMDMDAAFTLLRGHARRTRQPLSDIAGAVVAGELGTDQLRARRGRGSSPHT